jgi:hypothetical protein
MLCKKFVGFLAMRADSFFILRRKAVQGYDISFLITNFHTEQMIKHKLVDFVIQVLDLFCGSASLSVHVRHRQGDQRDEADGQCTGAHGCCRVPLPGLISVHFAHSFSAV